MSSADIILSELKGLSNKTEAMIKQNETILSKLTAMALGPDMKTFDNKKQGNIYATIGITSMRIIQMKALLESQKSSRTKLRITEFLTVPLVIIKKILGISSHKTNENQEDN